MWSIALRIRGCGPIGVLKYAILRRVAEDQEGRDSSARSAPLIL
jgi:hypothetical protein